MYDVTALGELLVDFTPCGYSEAGMRIFEQNPGGAPANVLTALAKLGMNTAFIGKVGSDMHGMFLKETLKQQGIETKGLIVDNHVFTTLAFVELKKNGERSFSFARKPGADICLTKEEVDIEIIKNSKILHVGSLSLTDEPSRSATIHALEVAKKEGITISYDPNYRALLWESEKEARKMMRSIISYVDVIKISDEEIELMTGEVEFEKAAKKLANSGVSVVVITLGKEGAYVYTKDGGLVVPGFTSKVIDTTGAGDSFWGGFLYKMLESGKNPSNTRLEEAKHWVRFANAVASVCVEKRGGIPAMPNLDQVLERYKQDDGISKNL